jgi:hypothetical protein
MEITLCGECAVNAKKEEEYPLCKKCNDKFAKKIAEKFTKEITKVLK